MCDYVATLRRSWNERVCGLAGPRVYRRTWLIGLHVLYMRSSAATRTTGIDYVIKCHVQRVYRVYFLFLFPPHSSSFPPSPCLVLPHPSLILHRLTTPGLPYSDSYRSTTPASLVCRHVTPVESTRVHRRDQRGHRVTFA